MLYSTDQLDFTFIKQVIYKKSLMLFYTFTNIHIIGVKIAKTALRLADTTSHPYALSNIVLPVPYKGKHIFHLFFSGVPYYNYV